jgi:preprotein translocase subunit SecY
MAPSKQDMKGVFSGLGFFIVALIIFNIFARLFNFDFTAYLLSVFHYLDFFIAIFIYAAVISFLHFVISGVVLLPLKR